MSLNDFSIYESRDAEFFEHVFPLKKNVSTVMHETMPAHDNVNMPTSSFVIKDLINEPMKSKRRRVETIFGYDFLTTFLLKTLM